MAKKMTQKEFFEVLKQADCSVFDYEMVLNALASHFYSTAFADRQQGYLASARKYIERADYLFNYLESRGFYESEE